MISLPEEDGALLIISNETAAAVGRSLPVVL
jgi:hypothetical protein